MHIVLCFIEIGTRLTSVFFKEVWIVTRDLLPDDDTVTIFQGALEYSRLPQNFVWIIAVADKDIHYDSITLWGALLPSHIQARLKSDQEFEDWKNQIEGPSKIFTDFRIREIGGFRHGFTLMSCDGCGSEGHQNPIILYGGQPMPRHGILIQTVYGKPISRLKDQSFQLISVYGGLIEAYPNPPTTGGLPVNVVLLRPKPFK